ncbi:hypothetical protein D3C80_1616820 [compost metagenome]
MNLSLYWIAVYPLDLIQYGLFGLHLNVFVDGGPQIIAFDRRYHLDDAIGHILGINSNAQVAVTSPQFALVLQLKPIEPYKLIIPVGQTRISVIPHSGLNVQIDIQTFL